MKKLLCVLLLVIMALSCVACGKDGDDLVTIYIPETVQIRTGSDAHFSVQTYIFEEGWQDKERFTVWITNRPDDPEYTKYATSVIYWNNQMIQGLGNGTEIVTKVNEWGKTVETIRYFPDGKRIEDVFSYDASGRLAFQEYKKYDSAEDCEPMTTTMVYVFPETEMGNIGTATDGSTTYVLEYGQNDRLTVSRMIVDGQEKSRTEYEYDEFGNLAGTVSCQDGKNIETKYTWKAVEVRLETAERFPQFRRGQ